jgi:hypothetical protein
MRKYPGSNIEADKDLGDLPIIVERYWRERILNCLNNFFEEDSKAFYAWVKEQTIGGSSNGQDARPINE